MCLKVILKKFFSSNANVNVSIKFLLALGGLLEGTQAFAHSESTWSLGRSEDNRRAFKLLGQSST